MVQISSLSPASIWEYLWGPPSEDSVRMFCEELEKYVGREDNTGFLERSKTELDAFLEGSQEENNESIRLIEGNLQLKENEASKFAEEYRSFARSLKKAQTIRKKLEDYTHSSCNKNTDLAKRANALITKLGVLDRYFINLSNPFVHLTFQRKAFPFISLIEAFNKTKSLSSKVYNLANRSITIANQYPGKSHAIGAAIIIANRWSILPLFATSLLLTANYLGFTWQQRRAAQA